MQAFIAVVPHVNLSAKVFWCLTWFERESFLGGVGFDTGGEFGFSFLACFFCLGY